MPSLGEVFIVPVYEILLLPQRHVARPTLVKIFHQRLSIRAEGRIDPGPVLEIIRHVLPPSLPAWP